MTKIQENIKHLTGRPGVVEPLFFKTTINEIFTKIYGEDWIDDIILDWVYIQGYLEQYDSFEMKRFLENNKDEPIEVKQVHSEDVWFEISFTLKGKKVVFDVAGRMFEGIKHLAGRSQKDMEKEFYSIEDRYARRDYVIQMDNVELLKTFLKEDKEKYPHTHRITHNNAFTSAALWGALNCLKYLLENEDSMLIESKDKYYAMEKVLYYGYKNIFDYLIKDKHFSFALKDEYKDSLSKIMRYDRISLLDKYNEWMNTNEQLKNKFSNMKKLNEQGGEQIYSEAHAKELLNSQVQYNKELQALNDRLAKKKSELAIKYMKLDQQAAAQKATAAKTQVPPAQKQTGTVDTTGQPVNAQGNPPPNESISILKIKSINTDIMNEEDDEPRYAKNLGFVRDKRNWYQKPENREGYIEPEPTKAPRKHIMTYKRRMLINDMEDEIRDLEREKQDLQQRYFDPEDMSGEMENFFGEIGTEASEIMNSGAYKTTLERINALIKAGYDERKAKEIIEVYHEYYPEFNPKKEREKKQAEKEIAKLQTKIDKIQTKIDSWETMYESDKAPIAVDKNINESLSTYNTKGADKTELQSLKDYMNAEGIEYTESEDTIEFDEEQLDAEWRELISLMGLEPTEISATVDPEDEEMEKLSDEEDDIDIVDVEEDIDEDKVFYVRVTEEGEEFIGKIYKLFDEGDWRSVLVLDSDSKTFEKLNYEPDWDEVDIIAFLRENYDDAELVSEDEFNDTVEEPKEEVEEALSGNGNIKDKTMKEAYKIPTLDEFKLNESKLKFTDGEEFETDGPFRSEERSDGWYVLGQGFLVPVKTKEEGEEIIADMNKKYGNK